MASRDAVVCRDLLRVYDSPSGRVQAVRGLDMVVPEGEVTAVVGPSGSGKSSLLRMISGLDRPTAGDVVIGGVSLGALSERRLRRMRHALVSNIYQRPGDNLLPNHTAIEQIRRVALRRGAGPREADAMLDQVGLGDRRDHRPHEMSGGEQQRLAFARGAVGSPTVVISDEPTAELDSHSGSKVIETMRRLAGLGATIVVATHDRAVMRGADHIVTLRDGALASVTSRDEELAVIDISGRIQLPPHVRDWFPRDRAVLHVDEANHRIWIERP